MRGETDLENDLDLDDDLKENQYQQENYIIIDKWELKVKEHKLFEARENAIVVNFESDWLKWLHGFS